MNFRITAGQEAWSLCVGDIATEPTVFNTEGAATLVASVTVLVAILY